MSQPAVTDLIRTHDGLFLDFARRDLGHPELPDLAAELLETVYRRCHAENPVLVCRSHRHPMSLRMDAGRLSARHINPDHEQTNHGPSPEHKACKERILAMADARGLTAVEESGRGTDGAKHPGRVSDVLVRGERTIGFEPAYTDSAVAVARKFNRGVRNGVTVYFGGPRERAACRNFVDRAPHGVYNDIPALEISRGRPMPIISGLRQLHRWRCASEPLACPHFGTPTRCARSWHSAYAHPLGQIDQDEVVYNLAVGLWSPVCLPLPSGKSTWQIVPANTIEDFVTDGGTILPESNRHRPQSATSAAEDRAAANTYCRSDPPPEPTFLFPPQHTGPCARCQTPHHRYGEGGRPLCPRCHALLTYM